SNRNIILGNSLLLLASLCWAGTILHTRFGTWHRSPLELIPWQLLISIIPPACLLKFLPSQLEQPIQWSNILISIILYNGIIATAFGYWANLTVSKRLPITITSLSMLAVPMLSIIFSVIFLKEPFTTSNIIAVTLVFCGLGCIAFEELFLKIL